jgi:Protein of unknown function (DUF3306)
MSSEGNDFLSRWSRRKIEMRREKPPVAAPAPVALPEPEDAQAVSGEEAALTPEELAALPSIEELTPDTDITVFLRKGVPEFLKNAALRRMWSLDPAIRDYVGDARDYSYDWNVPGGVPGNGPLPPGDDVEAMVGRMFGDRPSLSERLQATAEEELAREAPPVRETQNNFGRTAAEADPSDSGVALQHDEPLPSADVRDENLVQQGGDLVNPVRSGAPPDVALPSCSEPGASPGATLRRHGGAKPV